MPEDPSTASPISTMRTRQERIRELEDILSKQPGTFTASDTVSATAVPAPSSASNASRLTDAPRRQFSVPASIVDEQTNRKTRTSTIPVEDAQRGKAPVKQNSDASWVPLLAKEKGRPKNALPATDKTLLQLLQEERSKYAVLEQTYNHLLSEVKSLQVAHTKDLLSAEQTAESALQSLHSQLTQKSELLIAQQHATQRLEARLEAVEKRSASDAERADVQYVRVCAAKRDSDQKIVVLETLVAELKAQKGDLEEAMSKREGEIKKLVTLYKDREAELSNERDTRMKSELCVLKLEQSLDTTSAELKAAQEQLRTKAALADECSKLKDALAIACREIEQRSQREKMYLQEIEETRNRENSLSAKLDHVNGSLQKSMAEIERASSMNLAKSRDIDALKSLEGKLRSDLQQLMQSKLQLAQNYETLEKELRVTQQDKSSLQQDISDLRSYVTDLSSQLKLKTEEVSHVRSIEAQLRRDAQTLQSDMLNAQDDASNMQMQVIQVSKRLEMEMQGKGHLQETLNQSMKQQQELQDALFNSQSELESVRKTNESLKQTLQEQEHSLRMLSQQNQSTNESLLNYQSALEALQEKRRQDMAVIQEKYLTARSAMEQQLQNAESQLKNQIQQNTTYSQQIHILSQENQKLTRHNFALELKLADAAATDAANSRAVAALRGQLRVRDVPSAGTSYVLARATSATSSATSPRRQTEDDFETFLDAIAGDSPSSTLMRPADSILAPDSLVNL